MKTAVHLLAVLTLLAATPAAPAQLAGPPLPPRAADELAQRMAERRAQQLPPNVEDDVAQRMAERRAQLLQQNLPYSGPGPVPATVTPAPSLPATPPATAPAALDWPDLVTRLASDSFSEREAAQSQLKKTTWRDHARLKQLVESTPDPEANARLASQLRAIEELIAYDPPPISLDLNNASIADMVRALEIATGEKFSPDNLQRNVNGRGFTLSVKDQPFWEVFRELNAQQGLRIQGHNGLSFYQTNPGMKPTQIIGGMAVFAQSISRSSTVNLQNDPGVQPQPASLSIQYTVALDPRLKVVKYQQPRLLEVIDDAGNPLLQVNPNVQQNFGWNTQAQVRVWSAGQSLQIPEKIGKKIVSAKGEFRAVLQLATEIIDVIEPEKKLNQPFTVGGQTATIAQFAVEGSIVRFNISRQNQPNVNMQEQPVMVVSFIDANGTLIWSNGLQGSTGGSAGGNNIVPPVKVQFSVPTKTKEITIPFQFKDLPLPPP